MLGDTVNTKLRRALARIRKGWVQGKQASDAQGGEVGWNDPSAVRWCLAASVDFDYQSELRLLRTLRLPDHSPTHTLVAWNEAPERTREQVIALLENAIADAETV